MNLRLVVLSLMGVACIFAAPIQPTLTLSNFQSSAQLSELPTGFFYGFAFSPDVRYDSADPLTAYVSIGKGAYVWATPAAAQSVHAEASVVFDVPGYRVTRIFTLGSVASDGASASGDFAISSPCQAYSHRICALPEGGTSSGTIVASMDMFTTTPPAFPLPDGGSTYLASGAHVFNPTLQLTLVHNPEPASLGLIAVGIVFLAVKYKRLTVRLGRQ